MKILIGTKIYMLYCRNYVISGCVITGFHCIFFLAIIFCFFILDSFHFGNDRILPDSFVCCSEDGSGDGDFDAERNGAGGTKMKTKRCLSDCFSSL